MEFTSVRPTALKWGGISGVISIATFFLSKDMDPSNTGMTMGVLALSLAIGVGILYMAFKEYKAQNNGFMTLGKAMSLGILTFLVSGLIAAVWTLIWSTVIDPNFSQNLIDRTMDALEADPNMTEDALNMMEGMYSSMFSPVGQFFTGLISSLLSGTILSLIVGAITKKDPN